MHAPDWCIHFQMHDVADLSETMFGVCICQQHPSNAQKDARAQTFSQWAHPSHGLVTCRFLSLIPLCTGDGPRSRGSFGAEASSSDRKRKREEDSEPGELKRPAIRYHCLPSTAQLLSLPHDMTSFSHLKIYNSPLRQHDLCCFRQLVACASLSQTQ